MSALALRSTGKWSAQELDQLWTEEAMTAAVLPRYHIDISVKRALGSKLGRLRAASEGEVVSEAESRSKWAVHALYGDLEPSALTHQKIISSIEAAI